MCEKVVGNQPLVHDKSGGRSMDLDDLNHKRFKKSRKKPIKYQALSLHVGSKFFVMASLGLQKKKKSKKIKRRQIFDKEKLGELISSSDVGPSSSGGGTETKSSYKHAANNLSMDSVGGSVRENIANGEFKKRIDQDNPVAATARHVEKFSGHSSVANQCDSRQTSRWLQDGNTEQMYRSSMNKLAQGLEGEFLLLLSWLLT